jgi:hypothetical protein
VHSQLSNLRPYHIHPTPFLHRNLTLSVNDIKTVRLGERIVEESPEIYVLHEGRQQGPFTKKEIGERLVWEEISLNDMWCRAGDLEWKPITSLFPRIPDLKWLAAHSWWMLGLLVIGVIFVAVLMGQSQNQVDKDVRGALFAGMAGFGLGNLPFKMGTLSCRPTLGKISGVLCGIVGSITGAIAALIVCLVLCSVIKKKSATSP